MKKIMKYSLSFAALALAGFLGACTSIDVEAPELPDLPTVSNLAASVDNRVVNLSWSLPSASLEIEGVTLKVNNGNEIKLNSTATSYAVYGQPMEDEYLYTVKLNYAGGYVSQGQSVTAIVPFEELTNLASFSVSKIEKRNVTFSWTLPSEPGITGVWVGVDGEETGTIFPTNEYPTGGTLGGQKTGSTLKYRAKVIYDDAYYSDGVVTNAAIPAMEVRTAFLLLADSPADLEDDDELVAAAWFNDRYVDTNTGDFITVDQLLEIDFDEYGVIWIMVDRVGLETGWQYLPADLISDSTISALKDYGMHGGSLYLSNMATQLCVPLGIVPEDMPINTFNSGEGGTGDDVWVINPHLGWDFQGTDNYYDRVSHEIYNGLTMEDPNGYGYTNLPLIGPGQREDHNSLWDINPYWHAAGDPAPNCVKWFENVTNSLVLATWGHVKDHCVAGLVEFSANPSHGKCIANGFAAYEWNQNSGINPYQRNIEVLTENILNYLK